MPTARTIISALTFRSNLMLARKKKINDKKLRIQIRYNHPWFLIWHLCLYQTGSKTLGGDVVFTPSAGVALQPYSVRYLQ